MLADFAFPAAFHFQVRIGPSIGSDTSFQDVSGLAAEMETETYSEGGENRFSYRLPKATKYQNLVLSRALAPRTSPLVRWCSEVLEGGLAKPIVPQPVLVFLLGADGIVMRAWSFEGAYPVKWQTDSFNSTKNEIAIEKIELSFNNFRRNL